MNLNFNIHLYVKNYNNIPINGKCNILGNISTKDDSPHSLIINYLGLDYKPTKFTHLLIGIVFYIIGVLIAQQQSIQNFWF